MFIYLNSFMYLKKYGFLLKGFKTNFQLHYNKEKKFVFYNDIILDPSAPC